MSEHIDNRNRQTRRGIRPFHAVAACDLMISQMMIPAPSATADPKFQFAQQVKYLLRYLELKSNHFVHWTKAGKRKGEFATPVYLSQIPLRGIWDRKKKKPIEEVDNRLDYAEVMEVAKDLAAEREWVYFSEHYQNGKPILQIAKEQNVSKETVGGACRIVVAKLRRYYNIVPD